MNELKKCQLCPKKCKVDRTKKVGFCKAKNKLKNVERYIEKLEVENGK